MIARRPPSTLLFLFAALSLATMPGVETGAQTGGRPSAFCHVTDGQFTVCPDGSREWSDVPVVAFPETRSFLYANQADLDPTKASPFSPVDTLVLMYDECGRTTPLGPDEYFRVSFKTVETENGVEKLEHYVIHIFSDGTILFIEDGVVQPPGRAPIVDGMRGAVGFGPSPNCAFDHVIAEFQVPLSITGNSYSPDPLFWSASAPPPPPPECRPGDIRVPVLINVLTGVNITDSQLEEMVNEANLILSQAGVCSDFTPGNIRRSGESASDQGNDDGKVSDFEMRSVDIVCGREVNAAFRGKGYKIVVANELIGEPTTIGLAPFEANVPCVYVRADAGDPGFVLAHEFGHLFGMHAGAIIGEDEIADEGGHSADPANLMEQSSGGGTELTPQQIAIIRAAASERSSNTEHGGWSDDLGDVSQPHIDIVGGSLFAENLSSDLKIAIVLGGLHPEATDVNTRFEMLFDTDDDPATGGSFGSTSGIDKVLEIRLAGRFPFTSPTGSMTAILHNVAAGTSTALSPGSVHRIQKVADSFSPTVPPVVFDYADSIRQSVPLPLLGLSAGQIPIAIRATNLDTGETDVTSFVFALSLTPGLRAVRPGFNANNLPGNDDGSTGLVPLGFVANFFGTGYGGLFINNNGNLTFDAPLSRFTPFGLTSTNRVIIAPFFADVDTRVGNVVTYGAGVVDGRPAFGANWPGVGCFDRNTSVVNFFQVLLIDRSDVGTGDFDIEFNYDSIQWETGQASGGNAACQGGQSARVGFSNGTGAPGTFFELPGSGINGAFLDSNVLTGLIHNRLNSDTLGRYVFRVRTGVPVTRDRDSDGVPDELDNCPKIANADQKDSNLNGIGDACETPGLRHSTAAFIQARFDGTTTVEPRSVLVAEEPSLVEQLVRVVNFRLAAGLAGSASNLTGNLVASLVELGRVRPEDAGALAGAVLQGITAAAFVAIDIRPGSISNPINLRSHGTVPVAILSSATFDARRVDAATVTLAGAPVKLNGHGRPMAAFEDVNGDGLIDLVVHVVAEALTLSPGDTRAVLQGRTFDGTRITGSDSIRVVR